MQPSTMKMRWHLFMWPDRLCKGANNVCVSVSALFLMILSTQQSFALQDGEATKQPSYKSTVSTIISAHQDTDTDLVQQRPRELPFDASKPLVIPFEWDDKQHPLPTVKVLLNGKLPARTFVLDTGTGAAIIVSEEAARATGLKETGRTTRIDGTQWTAKELDGAAFDILTTDGKSILLPGRADTLLEMPLSKITSFRMPEKIDGMIGGPFARDVKNRFDFTKKTWTLYLPGVAVPPPTDLASTVTLPLLDVGDQWTWVPKIKLPLNGSNANSLTLLLDTGSFTSCLSLDEAAAAGVTTLETSPYPDDLTSFTGIVHARRVRMPSLALGNLSEPNVDFSALPEGPKLPSTLGLNILSRFVITIDYSGKQVTLEHASNYPERVRTEQGVPDLTLLVTEGTCTIDAVRAGSRAEQAGLKKGDRLLRIDGMEVDSFLASQSPDLIVSLVGGIAGTEAKLSVSRDGVMKDFTYIREGFFGVASAGKSSSPFQITQDEASGIFHIEEVAAGSPGDKAGMHSGDELIAVEGKAVKGMTFAEVMVSLRHAMQTGKVTLTVRTPAASGSAQSREVHLLKPGTETSKTEETKGSK